MFDRRQFIAGAAATTLAAPAILRAQTVFRAYPFALGVAAGDPASDGFVIWTRLAPDPLDPNGGMAMAPMNVEWEVASDRQFNTIVAHGTEVAHPELAHSIHVELTGLAPARPYYYRFRAAGEKSISGRATTLPAAGASPQSLRFGVCGCQHYEDGYYAAYRHMAEEDLAFVYHYGDYIYEDRGDAVHRARGDVLEVAVRRQVGQKCFSLGDYRQRYGQYKSDPDLQRAHAAHTWFATFDDHEVADDWVSGHDWDNSPDFYLRRAAAFQAWYEHMPVRRALRPRWDSISMYRSARYGNLVQLDFLDTRQFRTDQPCNDGFVPVCPGVEDPNAAVLGPEQEAWLARNLARPEARWSAVAQQVMMMSLDRRIANEPSRILNMDSWAGYEVPRRRLLARMRGLDNVVVLTGDEHQNFAGLLHDRDAAVAVEFVGTSITSDGDGADRREGAAQILAENPQLKFSNYQRGYLTCDVTPDEWRTNFMVMDHVSTPDGTLSKRATWAVARGDVALREV
jgi:alkaline phosphatase D